MLYSRYSTGNQYAVKPVSQPQQIKTMFQRVKFLFPMRANATIGINSRADKGIKSGKFYKKWRLQPLVGYRSIKPLFQTQLKSTFWNLHHQVIKVGWHKGLDRWQSTSDFLPGWFWGRLSSQLVFRCDQVFPDCIVMDQGAKDYMDVPDSMGQRNDTVALEEDHAKLQISGVWGSLNNQMCEVSDMNQWTWRRHKWCT